MACFENTSSISLKQRREIVVYKVSEYLGATVLSWHSQTINFLSPRPQNLTSLIMYPLTTLASVLAVAGAVTATLEPAQSNTEGKYPKSPSCSRALTSSPPISYTNTTASIQDLQRHPGRWMCLQHPCLWPADLCHLQGRSPIWCQQRCSLRHLRSLRMWCSYFRRAHCWCGLLDLFLEVGVLKQMFYSTDLTISSDNGESSGVGTTCIKDPNDGTCGCENSDGTFVHGGTNCK